MATAIDSKASAKEGPHEEFEPLCKWQRLEDKDILEVHAPDFKKEQLKVQISNHGILKISGERPLEGSKRSKFYKEVPVPNHQYDDRHIHAKFVSGWLIITIPKTKPPPPHQPSKTDPPPSPKDDKPMPALAPPEAPRTQNALRAPPRTQHGRRNDTMESQRTTMVMRVAATAAAIAVLVASVVYIYKSTIVDEN